MASIKQNSGITTPLPSRPARRLPDLRNLGIGLRILVMVNLLLLIAAILQAPQPAAILPALAAISAMAQPLLLLSLLLLYILNPLLQRLPYHWGVVGFMLVPCMLASLLHDIGSTLFIEPGALPSLTQAWILSLTVAGLVLYYFDLRRRALSPAVTEARLQALQARIRPHFLFNSINAVLSLMRSHPRRAETALEDMAELFRVLMSDNRELVPLARELALSRQYLALEKLRLDERLTVSWQIDDMPPDALVPPLVLQPLLENAVYHGIEPLPEGGEIVIKIYTERHQVHIVLSNPHSRQHIHHGGNRMALTNIRERLALHFDAEASLTNRAEAGSYLVHIALPYRHRSVHS